MTQCEDDLLDVTKPFKKHRPSTNIANVSYIDANQRRRSARKTMEWQSNNFFLIKIKTSSKIVL